MTRGNSAQGGHNHPRAQADQASQDSAQDSAQALAQQFFVTFVYVADAGRGLQPQDVQAWHAWVARARASYPSALRAAIATLAGEFPVLWKQHVARGNPSDLGPVAQAWAVWRASMPAEQAQVVLADLAVLLEACAPASAPLWARLLGRQSCPQRLAAREKVRALLISAAPAAVVAA